VVERLGGLGEYLRGGSDVGEGEPWPARALRRRDRSLRPGQVAEWAERPRRGAGRQIRRPGDHLGERPAADEWHREVQEVPVFPGREHRHDVGVV